MHSNTSLLSQPQTIYNLESYWARRAFSVVLLTPNAFLFHEGTQAVLELVLTCSILWLGILQLLLQALRGTNDFQLFRIFHVVILIWNNLALVLEEVVITVDPFPSTSLMF